MMKGKSANFEPRLAEMEKLKMGVPANLAGFRAPMITVYEGDDVDQIIKEMEARGEIPPMEICPPNFIRVIALVIVKAHRDPSPVIEFSTAEGQLTFH